MARMDYTDFVFTIPRGDSQRINFSARNPGDTAAQDITGWTLRLTAKLSDDDTDAAAIFTRTTTTTPPGITIVDAPGGVFTATLLPANTAGLPSEDTTLFWDVQGTNGAGEVITLLTGKFIVKPDITRTA